jgi:hypothetical protein
MSEASAEHRTDSNMVVSVPLVLMQHLSTLLAVSIEVKKSHFESQAALQTRFDKVDGRNSLTPPPRL